MLRVSIGLDGKSQVKRPLGRPPCRWEDNIRMDLGEIRCEGVNWMHPAEDRDQWQALVNMYLRVPLKAGYFLTS
jgi:hypothetical protein